MDSSTSEDERASSISSGKKVRFDLNDEVFEIPNKWDRLSTRVAARRNKLVSEVGNNHKSKDSEHRGRRKQSKNKKVKKTVKTDSKSSGTSRTLASPSNQVLSLDSSVLSCTQTPQKRSELDKTLTIDLKTKKISPTGVPEVKLKLSHRDSPEIMTQSDIVLPKITYNSDLKKAIENAVVRNRISAAQGTLSPSKEHCYESGVQTQSQKRGSFSDSPNRSQSTGEINYSMRKGERLVALPEQEPKFSELSRDVESWIPFTNTSNSKEKQQRKPKREGTIKPAWMIPNSILY